MGSSTPALRVLTVSTGNRLSSASATFRWKVTSTVPGKPSTGGAR